MSPSADRASPGPAPGRLAGAVLHIADLTTIGGIPTVVRALAAGHRAVGLDVHAAVVATGRPEIEALAAPLRAADVTVHEVLVARRGYWPERRALTVLCRGLRPVVVHTHGGRSDVIGTAAARAAGLPIVNTLHGFTGRGWKNVVLEWLHRRSMRRVEAVVAVSRPLRAQLAAMGVPEQRLHVIPNAYAPQHDLLPRPEARRALGVTDDTPLIGWVGRLSREKAADVAIDALSQLRHPTARLFLVGDGPERAALTEQVRARHLESRVVLHGIVPDAGRLFSAFDAFVLSSHTEGTPIALFEAMHAGVPSVVTAVGGVPDIVSEAEAWLVRPGDPRALAQCIDALLAEPGVAASRAHAAHERLGQVYAPGPWLNRYEDLYRSVAR